jgi:hypothetical protein
MLQIIIIIIIIIIIVVVVVVVDMLLFTRNAGCCMLRVGPRARLKAVCVRRSYRPCSTSSITAPPASS